MKQLYITDISKPTIFEDYLGQDSRIALKSISIRPTWLNIYGNDEFTIRKMGPDQRETRITIMNGLYNIEDLAAIVNKQPEDKIKIFVLRNGLCRLHVDKGYTVVFGRLLHELLGLTYNPKKKYYMEGDYDGLYRTDVYIRLRLVCPQLDEDDCLLDGKKSKILALLPTKELDAWGDMITWSFDSPIYLPLKGSTDRLEFMLTDEYHHEKNVSFVGLTMHLLIE